MTEEKKIPDDILNYSIDVQFDASGRQTGGPEGIYSDDIVAQTFVSFEQHEQKVSDLKLLIKAWRKRIKEIVSELRLTREQAGTDALTKIPNRRAYDRKILREDSNILRSPEQNMAILMIDIDYFKGVNDGYGHQVGDKVLQDVAGVLKENLRNPDFIARYGGEEFAVILSGKSANKAMHVAERLRKAVEDQNIKHRFRQDALQIVTVSIGVKAITDAERGMLLEYEDKTKKTEEERIKLTEYLQGCADKALYASKKLGRNRVSLYEDIKDINNFQ
jgi:diguanylate cyclase (GGDEF)-like protein